MGERDNSRQSSSVSLCDCRLIMLSFMWLGVLFPLLGFVPPLFSRLFFVWPAPPFLLFSSFFFSFFCLAFFFFWWGDWREHMPFWTLQCPKNPLVYVCVCVCVCVSQAWPHIVPCRVGLVSHSMAICSAPAEILRHDFVMLILALTDGFLLNSK